MKINNAKRQLDDQTLKVILQAERSAALGTMSSSDLSEQRERNYNYYMGDMDADMPAPAGQSSAVSTDVQDVVEGLLPIILDMFVSDENVVTFKPNGPDDEEQAKQETDFINHVFYQENDGFLTLYTVVKDALMQKNGFVKWWMETEEQRSRETYKGLTEDAYAVLAADTSVKIVDTETYNDADPATGQPALYYNAVVETVSTVKRKRIAAVPPEEIIVSKASRTIQGAPYLAHVIQNRSQADWIAEFPDKEDLIRSAPSITPTGDNSEGITRQTVEDRADESQTAQDVNKDMRFVEVVEHYIRLVLEKDGVPRRYKVTTTGTNYSVLDIEEVSNWPFASGTPIIMPHRLFGRAIADLVADVQQVKTSLLRATMNNAYFANNARTEVSETHASENTLDDLLNNRVGGIVRTKMPGGIREIVTQPIGHWVMPAIEYMDTVRENRTGVSKYNQGLDADSLNHTATGITRIMDASEMRVKLVARVFAETLIVDMFRGLHQMCQEFSEEKEVVELRGKWVNVNPREWKQRRHLKVSLPLGGASKQQLVAFFGNLLNIQKEALQTQGGTNGPLVSLQNIYNTVEHMTALAGLKSVKPFMMDPGPPNPNAPPPPDPKMAEVNGKLQIAQQTQQAQQQSDQQRAAFEQQMEQQRAALKQQNETAEFEHKRQLDLMQFAHDKEMAELKLGHDLRLEASKASHEMKLNEQQAALDRTADSPV